MVELSPRAWFWQAEKLFLVACFFSCFGQPVPGFRCVWQNLGIVSLQHFCASLSGVAESCQPCLQSVCYYAELWGCVLWPLEKYMLSKANIDFSLRPGTQYVL